MLESFLSKIAFESRFRKKISCVSWKLSQVFFFRKQLSVISASSIIKPTGDIQETRSPGDEIPERDILQFLHVVVVLKMSERRSKDLYIQILHNNCRRLIN